MTLKILLTIFLIPSIMSAPQELDIQEFFNSGGLEAILYNLVIQKKILEHDLNPCTGEPPKTCTCNDGKTFPFSIEYRTDPCSSPAKLESCTCPDNSTVVKELSQSFVLATMEKILILKQCEVDLAQAMGSMLSQDPVPVQMEKKLRQRNLLRKQFLQFW